MFVSRCYYWFFHACFERVVKSLNKQKKRQYFFVLERWDFRLWCTSDRVDLGRATRVLWRVLGIDLDGVLVHDTEPPVEFVGERCGNKG